MTRAGVFCRRHHTRRAAAPTAPLGTGDAEDSPLGPREPAGSRPVRGEVGVSAPRSSTDPGTRGHAGPRQPPPPDVLWGPPRRAWWPSPSRSPVRGQGQRFVISDSGHRTQPLSRPPVPSSWSPPDRATREARSLEQASRLPEHPPRLGVSPNWAIRASGRGLSRLRGLACVDPDISVMPPPRVRDGVSGRWEGSATPNPPTPPPGWAGSTRLPSRGATQPDGCEGRRAVLYLPAATVPPCLDSSGRTCLGQVALRATQPGLRVDGLVTPAGPPTVAGCGGGQRPHRAGQSLRLVCRVAPTCSNRSSRRP